MLIEMRDTFRNFFGRYTCRQVFIVQYDLTHWLLTMPDGTRRFHRTLQEAIADAKNQAWKVLEGHGRSRVTWFDRQGSKQGEVNYG